jgi:hypothetical protein
MLQKCRYLSEKENINTIKKELKSIFKKTVFVTELNATYYLTLQVGGNNHEIRQ